MRLRALFASLILALRAIAQEAPAADPRERIDLAKQLAKTGSESIPQLRPLIKDPIREVRIEAVRALIEIGTQHSLDPLIEATRDNDPDVQVASVDGIVNFYLPGYVQSGMHRLGTAVKSRFNRENDQVIPVYVTVRPDAIASIGRLARGGSSMDSRANAARGLGVLRGRAAVPDLIQALQSKDDNVIFESLIALQKIGDPAAGPRVVFLVRDLQERVQIAAVETTGILQNKAAVPDLQRVFDRAANVRVRRSALAALGMLASDESRPYFTRGLTDKDEGVRAAAIEGLARIKNPADKASLEQAFNNERKMAPRLAIAFALVSFGNTALGELTPLTYLIDTLNSRQHRPAAEAYLIELVRDAAVRNAIHGALPGMLRGATNEEKMGLGRILAASGDSASVPILEPLAKDPDAGVAQESLRSLRILKARLP